MTRKRGLGEDRHGTSIIAELEFQYLERTPGGRAARRYMALRKTGALGSLRSLLKHHDDFRNGFVDDALTRRRDEYDYLLSFYGLVEVALSLGLVRLSDVLRSCPKAPQHLNDPSVRQYYQLYYPILLPQLLRLRFDGDKDRAIPRPTVPNAEEVFWHFCEIGDGLDHEEWSLDRFLWLLDSGVVDARGYDDGADLFDLLDLMTKPEKLIARINRDPDKRDDLGEAAIGFGKFSLFATAFDAFLCSLERYEELQSVLWHHHGYWFDKLSVYPGSALIDRITALSDGDPGSDGRRLQRALGRLCSGRYRWRVRERLAK